MKLLILFTFAIFCWYCEALQFTMCEMVLELRRRGFPEENMRHWICLVQSESSFRTDVIGYLNLDGSWDYGWFQISDKFWCNKGDGPSKDCDVSCNDLLTDDITKACICAQKIFSIQGFSAWVGWLRSCQGILPDISEC